MKQSQPVAVLTYGTSLTERVRSKTTIPTIDVTSADWFDTIESIVRDTPQDKYSVLAIGMAAILAKKRLPPEAVRAITEIEVPGAQPEESQEKPSEHTAAVRVGDVVVAPRFHDAVDGAKAWLSPHHITLIDKLLGDGYSIEILSETNELVRKLGTDDD